MRVVPSVCYCKSHMTVQALEVALLTVSYSIVLLSILICTIGTILLLGQLCFVSLLI